jgi:hypothetical protein
MRPTQCRVKKTFNDEVTYYDCNNLNQLTTERVLGGGATCYTRDVDKSLTKIEAPAVTLENKRKRACRCSRTAPAS